MFFKPRFHSVSLLQKSNKMLTLVVLLSVIGAAISWPANSPGRPGFCKDHACPTYTVISSREGYEVREYPPSTWLKTDAQPFISKQQMLEKLLRYVKASGISVTVPVLKEHFFSSPGIRSLALFLPGDIKNYLPPNQPDIYLMKSPPLTVYARSFTTSQWHQEARQLKQVAPSVANKAYYYQVPYDPPWEGNRHNEVWLIKK